MTLLVDTHAFLWYLMADARLSKAARDIMLDSTNQLLFSMASLWEIGIKISIGKLSLPAPFLPLIPQKLTEARIATLEIRNEHIDAMISLPFHHKDPFDRMLVAQCMVGTLPLLSADAVFDQYAVKRLW